MLKNKSDKKGIFTVSVLDNARIGDCFFRLSLELSSDGAKAFRKTKPGQFTELELSSVSLPSSENIPAELAGKAARQVLLRRPFSFCNVESANNKTILEILYCVLGPATLRMKTLKPSDKVSLIGPLGNGFRIDNDKKTAILVAGGMGIPPLIHLAKELNESGTKIIAFVGAKSLGQLPCQKVENTETLISTDDGSAGFKGFVTETLKNWLKENNPSADETIIYTCGPEIMMAEVAKIAAEFNIAAQVSLERIMACGTGLCQGCAVKCLDKETGKTGYKLCCKDGPVFDSDEVVF